MSTPKIPFSKHHTLMGCRVIATRFIGDIPILSTFRTTWTPEYGANLLERIDLTFASFLGRDASKLQRLKTMELLKLMAPVKKDLSILKVQIEVDFPKDEGLEILKQLGYTKYFVNIRKGDQESLIAMLNAFIENLTPELKAKIVNKGILESALDNIIAACDNVLQANTEQEILKDSANENSHEAMVAIANIYNEVIGICKIANRFFMDNDRKKIEYSFSHVVSNLDNKRKKDSKNTDLEDNNEGDQADKPQKDDNNDAPETQDQNNQQSGEVNDNPEPQLPNDGTNLPLEAKD